MENYKITAQEIRSLVEVALGREEADIAILGGTLINVYSGELQRDITIGIKGRRIAHVGKNTGRLIGSKTQVIDAKGKFILPGLVEGHTHISCILRVGEFVRYALLKGTTTVITEVDDIANAIGVMGINHFLEELKKQPMRFFITVPWMVPPFPQFDTSPGLDKKDFISLLQEDITVGVGESYWSALVDGDERSIEQSALAINLSKTLEGHSAGAKSQKLIAYCTTGISSCHEAISKEEALELLRLGLYVMIREGYVRKDLEALSSIKEMAGDLRRLVLVTDWASPKMLLEEGYMDALVRKAIQSGFSPVQAVQMGSLNVCEHFGLRQLGGIAPGKLADVLIIKDLEGFFPEVVLCDGKVVAEEGSLKVSPYTYDYPDFFYRSLDIDPVKKEAFFLKTNHKNVRVRAVEIINEMITGEKIVELDVKDGNIPPDPQKDVLKMAVIARGHPLNPNGIGFLCGFGLKSGAAASTLLWGTSNFLVVGASEEEMVFAANRIIKLRGGFVVCQGETILAELPLPIAGIISELPCEEVARRMDQVDEACKALGSSISKPILLLQSLAFTGLPFLRLTDKGLLDIRKKALVDAILF
jgi:adenine deaminase